VIRFGFYQADKICSRNFPNNLGTPGKTGFNYAEETGSGRHPKIRWRLGLPDNVPLTIQITPAGLIARGQLSLQRTCKRKLKSAWRFQERPSP
jgi:hypothetical protein